MTSQYNESEIIRNYFRERKGKFLDIGAFDGVKHSNTHDLTLAGWSGVYIEPCLDTFRKLHEKKGAKHVCLHGACGRVEGIAELKLSQVPEQSTLYEPTVRLPHMSHMFEGVEYVPVFTINQLDGRFGGFEFISIDAEGMDYEVLCGGLNALLRTELICIEKGLPGRRDEEAEFKDQNIRIHDLMNRIGWKPYEETQGNLFFTSPTVSCEP